MWVPATTSWQRVDRVKHQEWFDDAKKEGVLPSDAQLEDRHSISAGEYVTWEGAPFRDVHYRPAWSLDWHHRPSSPEGQRHRGWWRNAAAVLHVPTLLVEVAGLLAIGGLLALVLRTRQARGAA